jgi:threonyl-tRNA synthetase
MLSMIAMRSQAIGSTSRSMRAWVVRATSGTRIRQTCVPVDFSVVDPAPGHPADQRAPRGAVCDPRGREETLSTIQIDLLLPERFGLRYQRDDQDQRPIMVHRSVISTMERMVAHLLEVHNGALPAWLSPTQILVLPASVDSCDYASTVRNRLVAEGLRADLDERDSTLGARIRFAQQQKIPYLAVVGPREQQAQTVSIRLRSGEQLAPLAIERFAAMAGQVVRSHASSLANA